jgi:hypothetical protein
MTGRHRLGLDLRRWADSIPLMLGESGTDLYDPALGILRHNTIILMPPMFHLMFVRVKSIGGRRYAYLVEGVREGGRVRQKTLCYLGPLPKLASGVPEDVRRAAERSRRVDWRKVNDEIGRIPLTFAEALEARRRQFAVSVRTREGGRRVSVGSLPRVEGELSALAKVARARFAQMFEEVGESTYRMR